MSFVLSTFTELHSFDPEVVAAMNNAYDDATNALGIIASVDGSMKHALAQCIVDLAKRRERDPLKLSRLASSNAGAQGASAAPVDLSWRLPSLVRAGMTLGTVGAQGHGRQRCVVVVFAG